MKNRFVWAAAGLVLGLVVALSLPSIGQETPTPGPDRRERTVTVTGRAIVRQAPDEAVITFGVRTQAGSAEEAMRENASKMNAVLDAVRALGIRADDLATASIDLWPRYSDDGLHVIGYTAENQVNVTVREMARVGRVIDRAVGAGANLLGGVTFRVADERRGREQALAEAVADARARAEALVRAAGAQLGQVVTVEEISAEVPPPVFWEERAVAAEAGTPVEPPTLETRVTVRVVWLIA